ncbi:hypothetical protein L495_3525 [Bordetella bronchiseptica CARE970018BB]|nr:hypothetical protein L495_3525 [Bordetella bronchiseptica CARE970018BB]KDC92133.1 hypothetical protein L517_3470 [Bordetella bronchiseptica MBORD670]
MHTGWSKEGIQGQCVCKIIRRLGGGGADGCVGIWCAFAISGTDDGGNHLRGKGSGRHRGAGSSAYGIWPKLRRYPRIRPARGRPQRSPRRW